jgi:hypothetical protein
MGRLLLRRPASNTALPGDAAMAPSLESQRAAAAETGPVADGTGAGRERVVHVVLVAAHLAAVALVHYVVLSLWL